MAVLLYHGCASPCRDPQPHNNVTTHPRSMLPMLHHTPTVHAPLHSEEIQKGWRCMMKCREHRPWVCGSHVRGPPVLLHFTTQHLAAAAHHRHDPRVHSHRPAAAQLQWARGPFTLLMSCYAPMPTPVAGATNHAHKTPGAGVLHFYTILFLKCSHITAAQVYQKNFTKQMEQLRTFSTFGTWSCPHFVLLSWTCNCNTKGECSHTTLLNLYVDHYQQS